MAGWVTARKRRALMGKRGAREREKGGRSETRVMWREECVERENWRWKRWVCVCVCVSVREKVICFQWKVRPLSRGVELQRNLLPCVKGNTRRARPGCVCVSGVCVCIVCVRVSKWWGEEDEVWATFAGTGVRLIWVYSRARVPASLCVCVRVCEWDGERAQTARLLRLQQSTAPRVCVCVRGLMWREALLHSVR